MTNIKQQKAYRHGEIAFMKCDKLPEGLERAYTKTFSIGSHNNPHTYDNGSLYLKNEDIFVFGYFEAKNTKLYHIKHGEGKGILKIAKLPDGIYQLRRQVEIVNSEMKPVID